MKNSKVALQQLRSKFIEYGINGYIIPSANEYQINQSPVYAQRLNYVTNFSGSYGIAVITMSSAILFTDGRYLVQASQQVDTSLFKVIDIQNIANFEWQHLISNNDSNIVGYDPYLFNMQSINYFRALQLKPIEINIVDTIWQNQPSKPTTPIWEYEIVYTGESCKDKISRLFAMMQLKGVDGYLMTDSTDICWLLNLRAHDTEYVPVLLLHAYVDYRAQLIHIFTSTKRLDSLEAAVKRCNIDAFVRLHSEAEIDSVLGSTSGKILVSDYCSLGFLTKLQHCQIAKQSHDLCTIMKARKNAVEIAAAQQIHISDAVAVCEFLGWLDDLVTNNNLQHISLTEYDLAIKISTLRQEQPGYVCDSFSPICGLNENGAIIHYNPIEKSSKLINQPGILLIDSGGHYLGGTTDVTRTIAIQHVTYEQKQLYTKVLQGHIALATIKFPSNTMASNLDILARQELWRLGLDYPHSTGHGVSNCLSVHEGPQRISQHNNGIALAPGMIVSNEPGYYAPGKYGIRIENLMVVQQSKYVGFLELANLTLIPYCQDLIIVEMLTDAEKDYIRCYYQKIEAKVQPMLSAIAKIWLSKCMDPIKNW